MRNKNRTANIIFTLILVVFLIGAMFPIYWMLNTSLKTTREIYMKQPTMFPKNVTGQAYSHLFSKTKFPSGLKNSFIVSITVSVFTILLSFPAAYALGRIVFKGRKALSRLILFCYLLPTAILYLPLYMLVADLKLSNSLWGLILIYPTFTLPYATWVMIPAVRSVPFDIEEAATVDGSSRFRNMFTIVLPLIKPSLVTTFIFTFAQCWGEYLYALVNITNQNKKTFPLIISDLIFGDIYPWDQIMAGGIISSIPILIIYLIANKFMEGGATSGAVKA